MKMLFKQYPPQIKYIVGNEAAERFSFYGMKSILVVFMTHQLLISKDEAVSHYHNFTAACYLLPLLGSYLSDRYLGKYKTILYLSIFYCLGHLVLALFETKLGLLTGLALISLGAGGIKPCVTAHVGDQFTMSQNHLIEKIYNLFYWMINFGSFFSTILTPWTLEKYGSTVAFGIPGILMFVATFVFWLGRNKYIHIPPTGKNPHGFLNVIYSGLKNKIGDFRSNALHEHPKEVVDGVISILKLLVLYIWISVFWSLFDQSGSTWVLQAQKMELEFLGIKWSESQIQALNPILVLILIPIFSKFIYPFFDRIGYKLNYLRKMTIGMVLASFSFFTIAFLQYLIEQNHSLNIFNQFYCYLLLTMAEVMLSVTGYEFAYTQAPPSMKSTIMSFWLLTVFFGNIIAAQLAHISWFEVATYNYFMFYAILMLVVAIIFGWTTKFYKVKNYINQ